MTMPRNNGIAHVAFDHEDSLRSREFIISWLTPTPHATAVYASCSASPPPHATLASRRLAETLPGPDLHRLIAPPSLAPSFIRSSRCPAGPMLISFSSPTPSSPC